MSFYSKRETVLISEVGKVEQKAVFGCVRVVVRPRIIEVRGRLSWIAWDRLEFCVSHTTGTYIVAAGELPKEETALRRELEAALVNLKIFVDAPEAITIIEFCIESSHRLSNLQKD